MGAFGGFYITKKGKALLAKAQLGTKLEFTKVELGDGQLSGQDSAFFNGLVSSKKVLPITKLKKIISSDDIVVGTTFTNQDITTGFYLREIGIFALDPEVGTVLYAYANSGTAAEYIPPVGGPDIVEKYIDMIVKIGNVSNVTATIDNSLIYCSLQEFSEHVSASNPHTQYVMTDGSKLSMQDMELLYWMGVM